MRGGGGVAPCGLVPRDGHPGQGRHGRQVPPPPDRAPDSVVQSVEILAHKHPATYPQIVFFWTDICGSGYTLHRVFDFMSLFLIDNRETMFG